MAFPGGTFRQGTGKILLAHVECSGTEMSLGKCPISDTSGCNHREDAGVRCSGKIVHPLSALLKD